VTRPTLTFIAGANGSGKTTLTRWNSELFKEIPLLDPDAVANTLQATAPALLPMAAGRHVLKSAREHLKEGESFAVETTLAGKNYLHMMLDAKKSGLRNRAGLHRNRGCRDQSSSNQKSGFGGRPRRSRTRRSATLQTQLREPSRRNRTCRSRHPLRQLHGGWLSAHSDLKYNGKSMARAKAVLDHVCDVTQPLLILISCADKFNLHGANLPDAKPYPLPTVV
jgi:hypothetical protein